MSSINASPIPTIPEWFRGRNIFVTGGTGFLGKVLLEKLLRSIPDIGNIYTLVRPKYGKLPNSRIEEITKLPLFQNLRENHPQVLTKLVAIEGDITADNLGINESNTDLIHSTVSVVFHIAATIKLEAPLKDAVAQNVFATEHVMKLCKGIKQLEVIVHSSTAYCHCELPVVEEKVYPPTRNPYDIMNLVKWMDDQSLDLITPNLIKPLPNTYTFTKRLAETVADDYGKEYSVVIVRPSIVLPTIKEPIPGWVDQLNGPISILAASGKGVVRTMMMDREKHAEIIPVDTGSNSFIIAAWYRATRTFSETPVYNVTQGGRFPLTWGKALEEGRKEIAENPFNWPLWYPDGDIRTNKLVHNLIIVLFQIIPAYIVDFILLLFRQKRFMVRTQKRILQGLEVLQYFCLRQWNIPNSKFLAAAAEMCTADQKTFYTDPVPEEINGYLRACILGMRQYCLKEDLKSLPRARIYLNFLYILDRLCKSLFFAGSFWMLFKYSLFAKIFQDKFYELMVKV